MQAVGTAGPPWWEGSCDIWCSQPEKAPPCLSLTPQGATGWCLGDSSPPLPARTAQPRGHSSARERPSRRAPGALWGRRGVHRVQVCCGEQAQPHPHFTPEHTELPEGSLVCAQAGTAISETMGFSKVPAPGLVLSPHLPHEPPAAPAPNMGSPCGRLGPAPHAPGGQGHRALQGGGSSLVIHLVTP